MACTYSWMVAAEFAAALDGSQANNTYAYFFADRPPAKRYSVPRMWLKRTVLALEIIRVSRVAAMRLGSNLKPDGLREGKPEPDTATFMGHPAAPVPEPA